MENCLFIVTIITWKALDIHISANDNSSKITCKRQEKNCAIFLKIYFHGQLDDDSQPVSMWDVAQLF